MCATPSLRHHWALVPEHSITNALTYVWRFIHALPTLLLAGLNLKKWYKARQFGPTPLERSLISAYLRDEFVLHYQPIVRVTDRKLVGAEALIRWEHPESGLLPPSRFITTLCRSCLGKDVGYWVIREACKARSGWSNLVDPSFKISVNICGRMFVDQYIVSRIQKILQDTGTPGHFLELEVTERIDLDRAPHAMENMRKLQEIGISVAFDDFGTGFASMKHLLDCPVDRIKIDRSFLSGVPTSAVHSTACAHLIELAHLLDMEVTAEGVETEEQMHLLESSGCTNAQGFLFSPPAGEDGFADYLRERH
ncbi:MULTISPECIES: EAL domain-containing protein [unclassified Pseudovibrio]|uniref:EAL domain-containing protein n=1 Tax=unclassified Pseudovibrio TaxID=2627060 RepID=UPI0007AE5B56|nr:MULTISPECIES: EAL domain-containing protein [unclassified Pseudovibrio]KZL01223.1 Phytochrome-like protein cph2 [Pseudovibrio sp. W74]KZL11288.1 Phytochrome-like protein cph2 [Pseudovibrio sp. Ad14]